MEHILLGVLGGFTIHLTPPPPPPPPPIQTVQPAPKPPPIPTFGPRIYANVYAKGNCTKYVASKVAVPTNWGNAGTWLPRAKAQGYSVGDTPRVGAIAWFAASKSMRLGHVAYVEEVYPNGTFLISEMNWVGYNKVSKRVMKAGSLQFIYGKI